MTTQPQSPGAPVVPVVVREEGKLPRRRASFASRGINSIDKPHVADVAIFTGGWDKPYALGLTEALVGEGLIVDFLGTEEIDSPELHNHPRIRFLSLQKAPGRGFADKALRTFHYYWQTIVFALTAQSKVFHVLWYTKFIVFERTVLTLFLKLLGKRLVFTAHNVNAGKRDGNDNWLNRMSLGIQYRLTDHIFVHTEKMKNELATDFHVERNKVSVIPFGINDTVPDSKLTSAQARKKLGLRTSDKVMLFFGNIVSYKGLEFLIDAFNRLANECSDYRLVIAGKPKPADPYFKMIECKISTSNARSRILTRFEFVPDEQTEVYFKAADLSVLPYVHIFQSGVLFLSYQFGLPVLATDVGALREDVAEGKTGFICNPRDPADLAKNVDKYFRSDLYQHLGSCRQQIRAFAAEHHSWTTVARITTDVYRNLR
jgi:glycosyltransferase involved in cell wall biosynthesis